MIVTTRWGRQAYGRTENRKDVLELADIETVGVVGAGTMGSGISQVTARHGYDVVMRDVEEEYVDRGFDAIDESLGRFVENDTLTDEKADAVRERITGTTDLTDLAGCELVVEAAVEDLPVKRDVFDDLDEVVADGVVLATNTSPVPSRSP